MTELFKVKETKYSFRKGNALISSNIKTTTYVINSINHLAPKIWDLVPDNIKNSQSPNIFKQKIKAWIPINCPCTLCKHYIPKLGYIQFNSL